MLAQVDLNGKHKMMLKDIQAFVQLKLDLQQKRVQQGQHAQSRPVAAAVPDRLVL
jgi:hypothetical protein